MERSAFERVQAAYGGKYNPLVMYDSKRDVADLLNEHRERPSVREFLRQQKPQVQKIPQKRRDEQER